MAESSKKSGMPFKNKIEDWKTDAEIKILTDLMEKRDAGRVVSCMLVQQNTVYKNAFGTNFTKSRVWIRHDCEVHISEGDRLGRSPDERRQVTFGIDAGRSIPEGEEERRHGHTQNGTEGDSLRGGHSVVAGRQHAKDIMKHHEQQWLIKSVKT
eukprot:3607751-Rhodomonas_salina.1